MKIKIIISNKNTRTGKTAGALASFPPAFLFCPGVLFWREK